jgi:hypothetical protein
MVQRFHIAQQFRDQRARNNLPEGTGGKARDATRVNEREAC